MKTNKKLVSIAMAGMILFGSGSVVNSRWTNNNIDVYATSFTNEELDKLYAEGVHAVLKCQNEKTQSSVNDARKVIDKFTGKLDWAIGELSKQVDTVQHPILVTIVDGIHRNQLKPVQNDINKVKNNIVNLPREDWKKDYGSALDKAQQILINEANGYVDKYLKSGSSSDKTLALQKLNVLTTATNNSSVVSWANNMINKVNNYGQVSQIPSDDKFMKEVETKIFQRVNEERKKAGKSELKYSSVMEKYARIKSQDMGDRGYFDHRDPEGNLITVKMAKDGVRYNAWGENIAYIGGGSSDATSIATQFMNMWMNSQGHRANILSGNFSEIGIGVYKSGNKIYATQEFYR